MKICIGIDMFEIALIIIIIYAVKAYYDIK